MDFFRFERLVSKLDRPGNLPANVALLPWNGKLMLTAFCEDATLTLECPGVPEFEAFTLPWKTIKKIAAKRDESVEIELSEDSVNVTWYECGVPQHLSSPMEIPRCSDFALLPERHETVTVDVFASIAEAGKCTDTENTRYALGGVYLQGSQKRIAATDGRHLMILSGIEFPWEADVICPSPDIFGMKELREIGNDVALAYEDHGIYFQTGNVCVRFKEIDGRFPNVDAIATEPETMTWLHLDPADAKFLLASVDKLPCKDATSKGIFLDFSEERIAVVGYDDAMKITTELLLTRSRVEGERITAWTDRRFLKEAIQTEVERIGMDPGGSPFFSNVGSKVFIWMPLTGDDLDRTRFKVSTVKSESVPVTPTRTKPAVVAAISSVAPSTMTDVQDTAEPNTKPKETVSPPGVEIKKHAPMSKSELEAEADRLRLILRDALVGVNSLTREIRASRKRERELHKREQALIRQQEQLRSTIASIGKI